MGDVGRIAYEHYVGYAFGYYAVGGREGSWFGTFGEHYALTLTLCCLN